ncbi:hypothetical protein CBD41_02110, partial [bacterium TMED181]
MSPPTEGEGRFRQDESFQITLNPKFIDWMAARQCSRMGSRKSNGVSLPVSTPESVRNKPRKGFEAMAYEINLPVHF